MSVGSNIFKFWLVALAVMASATAWVGCGSTNSAATAALPAGVASTGQALYATHCASCHGASAAGGAGPDIRNESSASVQSAVRNGKGSMPAFSTSTLSDQSLADVIAFVDTL